MDTKDLDVRKLDLVFFDTELTGLDLKHEIVEIGFIKAKAGTFEQIAEGAIKIKPTRLTDANAESLAISGYNEKDWVHAVDLKTALTQFLQQTEGCMLVGHNLPMDWAFLKKGLEDCGLQANFYYKGLDTFALSWQKLQGAKDIKRFALSELAPHFGIDQGNAHRALDDARTTYQLFLKLNQL